MLSAVCTTNFVSRAPGSAAVIVISPSGTLSFKSIVNSGTTPFVATGFQTGYEATGLITMLGLRPGSELAANTDACAGLVGRLPSNRPVAGPVSRSTTPDTVSPLELATLTASSSTSAVRLRSGSVTRTWIGLPGLATSSAARAASSALAAPFCEASILPALFSLTPSFAITSRTSASRCSDSLGSFRAEACRSASETTVIGPPRVSGRPGIFSRNRSEYA